MILQRDRARKVGTAITPVTAAPPDFPHGPPTAPKCTKPCKPFVRVGDLTCPFVGCFDTGECA